MFTLVLGSDIWKSLQQLGCHHIRSSHKSSRGFALFVHAVTHTHTQTCLTAPFPGLPRWANTRKVKPIWILLMQETVSGSGISWAKCMSAPFSRQITTPTPHNSVLYRPDALPAVQPTYWKKYSIRIIIAFGHSTPGVQRSSCLVEFWFKWPSSSFY